MLAHHAALAEIRNFNVSHSYIHGYFDVIRPVRSLLGVAGIDEMHMWHQRHADLGGAGACLATDSRVGDAGDEGFKVVFFQPHLAPLVGVTDSYCKTVLDFFGQRLIIADRGQPPAIPPGAVDPGERLFAISLTSSAMACSQMVVLSSGVSSVNLRERGSCHAGCVLSFV